MSEYEIWVRCPKCGRIQRALLTKTHKCIRCGHTFTLFPKRQKSRVVAVKGDYNKYINDVALMLSKNRHKELMKKLGDVL